VVENQYGHPARHPAIAIEKGARNGQLAALKALAIGHREAGTRELNPWEAGA
jgi:hypothetical protein